MGDYKDIYIIRHVIGRKFEFEKNILQAYELDSIFGADRAGEILKEACEKLNLEYGEAINISQIVITVSRADLEIQELADYLIKESETVSGDDDYYDEFPDLVYAFEQICEAMEKQDIYKITIDKIKEGRYKNKDDIISF